jgi:hypothetical protein
MYPGYADISKNWPGYGLYASLADTPICWLDLISVNHYKVNHFSSYLSSLLTLPRFIPPTLVPKAVEVPQFLTEGPWQVQHTLSFMISRLLIICRRLTLVPACYLYVGTSFFF